MALKVEKCGILNFLQQARSRLLGFRAKPERGAKSEIELWLENCPFTAAPSTTWSLETTAVLIKWASEARWSYSEEIKILVSPDEPQGPPWLEPLYKIARYHSAIKSMVKLAAKQPELLADSRIQELKAPNTRRFTLQNEKSPLQSAVRRLLQENSSLTMERLQRHFGTEDVEVKLRKACRLDLTLHAEMQLLVFYADKPSLTPLMRFIGTSKKACFLCYEYLRLHPIKLRVSACHQKIYPSWMPPPYHPIPRQYKSATFTDLSRSIEKLARRELQTALNAPRRPANKDSTAGPSLTITATEPSGMELQRRANARGT